LESDEDPEKGAIQAKRGLALFGYAMLALGLPLALVAASLPANEYQDALGIDALDCDGPAAIFIFAVPALLIFGSGLVVNAMAWRKRWRLVLALACALICAALIANLTRAIILDREQAMACGSR
jgi:O-antigen ligase